MRTSNSAIFKSFEKKTETDYGFDSIQMGKWDISSYITINIRAMPFRLDMATVLPSTLRLTAEMDMTPEKALLAGKTIGRIHRSVTVGVGANPSSMMICNAMISGLLSTGADVTYSGIAPAPAVALSSGGSSCFAVIGSPDSYGMISKIDVYNPDGSAFSDEQVRHLVRISKEDFTRPTYKSLGNMRTCDSTIEKYNNTISSNYKNIDCPVILDCGCGSASLCAPRILASVGADVISINSQLDGSYFPRSPGVGKGDVTVLSEMVTDHIGSIGLALNGDGTRLALIDEGGTFVSEEEMLALVLLYLRPTKIAIPVNSSSLIDDAFWGRIGKGISTTRDFPEGREIVRSESSVESMSAAIRENKADIGSMNDSRFIFPRLTLCPDAINTAVLISEISGANSIRDIIQSFPKYITLSDVVRYTGNFDVFSKKVSDKLKDLSLGEVIHADGWRVEMEQGWFIITRKADPDYIDITAESKDKAYAVTMMELAKSIVYDCV